MTDGCRLRIVNRLLGAALALAIFAAPFPDAWSAEGPAGEVAQYYEDALRRFEAGEVDAAVIQLKNALKIEPDHVPSRLLIGRAYLTTGNGAAATESLERARDLGASDEMAYELAPDSANILDTYGWVLVRNGEAERGLAFLRDASARSATSADIGYHIAYALHALGRSDEALAELEKVFENAGREPLPSGAGDLLREITGGGS